ncbi:MAG: neutral/alkaline non-lysosomal ceramidase N-terminal domain-containing protein [Pirellulales bacterium]|nr:neutral/alkaline non-lysosomal ceramidase N-terminal domain-containing protein [Pirellulales bacterium]
MTRCSIWMGVLAGCLLGLPTGALAADELWQAGAAKVNITPAEFMWMSGYASRDKPADGKLTDLWAKALVLVDAQQRRMCLITLDLVGIDRVLAETICGRLEDRFQLAREQVAICVSHTHSGPVVGHNLAAMYFLDVRQSQLVQNYVERLQDAIERAVGDALAALQPAQVAYGIGRSTVAVNRRNNAEAAVPALRSQGRLVGPVDYDVPVLAVRDPDGKLRAVAFGYACHATVLSGNQWSGDYPGHAQIALEAAHPDCVALFWAGCGADQNPIPRREVALAEEYGRRLAAAVDEALAGVLTPLTPHVEASLARVDVAFDTLPTRDQLVADSQGSDRYVAARAKSLLARIEAEGSLAPSYPYPVQVWRLGRQLDWILLGGEVVVDYALRLKQEFGPTRTWVAGYTNDVMAYIPSRRVLVEGGYEGGGAMVYYGQPTRWAPSVEETIVGEVHRQIEALAAVR